MSAGWEELKPEIQIFGEKLLKAGWARKFKMDKNGVALEFTIEGREKMLDLAAYLSELGMLKCASSLEFHVLRGFLLLETTGDDSIEFPER